MVEGAKPQKTSTGSLVDFAFVNSADIWEIGWGCWGSRRVEPFGQLWFALLGGCLTFSATVRGLTEVGCSPIEGMAEVVDAHDGVVCFTVGGVGFKLGARVWFRAVVLLWGGCCGTSCEVWYGDRLLRKAEVRRVHWSEVGGAEMTSAMRLRDFGRWVMVKFGGLRGFAERPKEASNVRRRWLDSRLLGGRGDAI
ncbi:MAG: hypothetical protein ACTS4Y_01590 [Candidatus Hodgkinia cicadicola]